MSVDLLINLALADVAPGSPLVLPHEPAIQMLNHPGALSRLIAVWCEREPSVRLYDRIVQSRPIATELKRPLAIFTGTPAWELSVTGIIDSRDQFWMHCQRNGRPLHELRDTYEHEIKFCPLGHVVLVIDPVDEEDPDELAHLRTCRDIARAHSEVVGVVWLGTLAIEDLPGPPPVVELVEPLGWGQGGPTP